MPPRRLPEQLSPSLQVKRQHHLQVPQLRAQAIRRSQAPLQIHRVAQAHRKQPQPSLRQQLSQFRQRQRLSVQAVIHRYKAWNVPRRQLRNEICKPRWIAVGLARQQNRLPARVRRLLRPTPEQQNSRQLNQAPARPIQARSIHTRPVPICPSVKCRENSRLIRPHGKLSQARELRNSIAPRTLERRRHHPAEETSIWLRVKRPLASR